MLIKSVYPHPLNQAYIKRVHRSYTTVSCQPPEKAKTATVTTSHKPLIFVAAMLTVQGNQVFALEHTPYAFRCLIPLPPLSHFRSFRFCQFLSSGYRRKLKIGCMFCRFTEWYCNRHNVGRLRSRVIRRLSLIGRFLLKDIQKRITNF